MTTTSLRVAAIAARIMGIDNIPVAETKLADLGFTSLDKIELVVAMQDEFGVEIEEADEASIRTIADAADLVERLRKRAA